MTTMTREEAIEEFGRHFNVQSSIMPCFSLPDDVDNVGLYNSGVFWRDERNHGYTFGIKESFGSTASWASNWEQYLSDSLSGSTEISNEKVAAIIVEHARQVYDEKLLLVQNKECAKSVFQKAADSIMGNSFPLPLSKDLFNDFPVNVSCLPDQVTLPNTLLKVGDIVYGVDSSSLQNNGTAVHPYTVKIRTIEERVISMGRPSFLSSHHPSWITIDGHYDVRYIAESSTAHERLRFSIDHNGKIISKNDKKVFFVSLNEAKSYEAGVWHAADQKRPQHLKSTLTI